MPEGVPLANASLHTPYPTFPAILLLSCYLIACGPGPEQPDQSVTDADVEDNPSVIGVWERLSYPYGTIEFRRDSVRFVPGEGLAEEPEFQAYTLAASCPDGGRVAADFSVVVPVPEGCYPVRLRGDTLRIFYPPDADGVDYLRR